jgi:hypothetical protein
LTTNSRCPVCRPARLCRNKKFFDPFPTICRGQSGTWTQSIVVEPFWKSLLRRSRLAGLETLFPAAPLKSEPRTATAILDRLVKRLESEQSRR